MVDLARCLLHLPVPIFPLVPLVKKLPILIRHQTAQDLLLQLDEPNHAAVKVILYNDGQRYDGDELVTLDFVQLPLAVLTLRSDLSDQVRLPDLCKFIPIKEVRRSVKRSDFSVSDWWKQRKIHFLSGN